MRHQGRITQWNDGKGYGFISPNGGGEMLFLHVKAFGVRQPRPVGDEIVTYEIAKDAKGRLRAEAVAFGRGTGRRSASGGDRPARWPLVLATLFAALLLAAALTGKLATTWLALYAGASLATFIAYAIDKAAAREGRWRTPESTLHLLALIGGWPGALLAQRYLRHKSAKASFLAVFWLTVLLNCGALALLQNPAIGRNVRLALGVA